MHVLDALRALIQNEDSCQMVSCSRNSIMGLDFDHEKKTLSVRISEGFIATKHWKSKILMLNNYGFSRLDAKQPWHVL